VIAWIRALPDTFQKAWAVTAPMAVKNSLDKLGRGLAIHGAVISPRS